MAIDEIYCKGCGMKLNRGILGFGGNAFAFEDGYYCQKCGKIKVEEARKKIKDKLEEK